MSSNTIGGQWAVLKRVREREGGWRGSEEEEQGKERKKRKEERERGREGVRKREREVGREGGGRKKKRKKERKEGRVWHSSQASHPQTGLGQWDGVFCRAKIM